MESDKSIQKQPIQLSISLPAGLRLGPKAIQILEMKFANPGMSNTEIGIALAISRQRVGQILNHPRVIEAVPKLARAKVQSMVPKAVKAYEELVTQNQNLQVKEKAAGKVLAESKVFDAPTVKIDGNVTFTHVHELRQIVEKAHNLAENVVDVEIVDDKEASK